MVSWVVGSYDTAMVLHVCGLGLVTQFRGKCHLTLRMQNEIPHSTLSTISYLRTTHLSDTPLFNALLKAKQGFALSLCFSVLLSLCFLVQWFPSTLFSVLRFWFSGFSLCFNFGSAVVLVQASMLYICIYTYIYIEREIYVHTHTHTCIQS